MSSFTRRIQRSQPHKALRFFKKRGVHPVALPGRKHPFMGRGSRLGTSNPKDAALLARRARDKRWGRVDTTQREEGKAYTLGVDIAADREVPRG